VMRLLLVAALAVSLAACGGDEDRGAGETTAPAPAAEPPTDATWERVVPGGDCQCSDGSEFSFWVREASARKVLFFLEAGGACFSAATCAPERDLYSTGVEDPPGGGIFDFADERNPFADYSVVYVPYCTADAHIGNATVEYAPGLTIRHKGYANGTAALDHLVATFPHATAVVVAGESAGSIAAPLYAGLVSDRLPGARITVLADGSGAYPDGRRVNEIIARWGFGTIVPPWFEQPEWSPSAFFVQSARHDPEILFARHDYAYDEKQEFWYPFLGIAGKDVLSLMRRNEQQIEDAGATLLSYVAPGSDHTVIGDGPFYAETVDGVKLVDWVTRLIAGEPVDDMHCRKCRAR
jgi:Pectinacetylesterase